ncbi:MAG: hypothetical protein R2845_00965 [Thermomicrobiales bacterium]
MSNDNGTFNIYTVTDPRPQFLTSIGLVPAPLVEELSQSSDNVYFGPVSFELAETLVADVTIFWFTNDEEYATLMETEAYKALPAVVQRHVRRHRRRVAGDGDLRVLAPFDSVRWNRSSRFWRVPPRSRLNDSSFRSRTTVF